MKIMLLTRDGICRTMVLVQKYHGGDEVESVVGRLDFVEPTAKPT